VYTESNDRAVYTTLYYDNGEPKKVNNKKEIMCFSCNKTGHYYSIRKEELPMKTTKKGSNMVILYDNSSVECREFQRNKEET